MVINDLFYSIIIRQLFINIYFIELYLTGLFFLIHNIKNNIVYIVQMVIIIIVINLIVIFYSILDYRYKLY